MQKISILFIFLLKLWLVSSLYDSKSHVKMQTIKTFDEALKKVNHLTVVEFFAPWCGYCKQFAPIYEEFAKKVSGYVNVMAIDCDDKSNQILCSSYNIQGFPTVKLFIPYEGKLLTEDYRGARSLAALMNTVHHKIPDYVTRFSGDISTFFERNNATPKVLLFTSKKEPNIIFKALAAEFLNKAIFTIIPQTFKEVADTFGLTTFPTIVILPGGNKQSIVYSGSTTFKDILQFFKKHLPYHENTRDSKSKESKKSKEFMVLELDSEEDFVEKCVVKKGISVIGIALSSKFGFFSEISKIYDRFYYYYINPSKESTSSLLKTLDISPEQPEILLLNSRKGWYIKFVGVTTAKELLKLISEAITNGSIEKRGLDKKIIDMALKIEKKEL